jgi:dGTPase
MSDDPVPLADRLLGYNSPNDVHLSRASEHKETGRTPFERDVDRIKYTPEFRRLKDVTQVARAGETYLYHDRLSHSLKVAQVGRRLAEYILRTEGKKGSDIEEQYDSELMQSVALSEGYATETIDPELRRQINPDIVEAACLAHDLGHPPFGHLAEEELDWLLQEKTNDKIDPLDPGEIRRSEDERDDPSTPNDFDEKHLLGDTEPSGIRFEGNAQSFRILTRLASYRDSDTGLGLTIGVLNGILKYPYGRGEWVDIGSQDAWEPELDTYQDRSRGKFGYYKTEAEAFEMIREAIGNEQRTIVAELMDYADDLTYAIHDLTDFYKDGRLPLDRLLREASDDEFEHVESRELDKLEGDLGYDDADLTPTEVIEFLASNAYAVSPEIFGPYEGTSDQKEHLEEFTSYLVELYLNRVYYPDIDQDELESDPDIDLYLTVEKGSDGLYQLIVSDKLKGHIDILQDLTVHFVIRNSTLMGQQRGQRQIIRELFQALYDEAGVSDLQESAIPKPYSDALKKEPKESGFDNSQEQRARIVADMISSMTEIQAVEFHKRLTGDSPGSLQDAILR